MNDAIYTVFVRMEDVKIYSCSLCSMCDTNVNYLVTCERTPEESCDLQAGTRRTMTSNASKCEMLSDSAVETHPYSI